MKSRKSLINTFIFLAILVVALLGCNYYLYRDVKIRNLHISDLEYDLSQEEENKAYLASTQKLLQNISPDIEDLNDSIISKDGDVEFIENFENLAKNNGLKITIDSLVFEEIKGFPSASVTSLKIRAKTEGSWSGTYVFLNQIEALPFKIKINKFSLINRTETLDKDKTNSIWQSTFEIVVLKYI
jgi:hypothetical protein